MGCSFWTREWCVLFCLITVLVLPSAVIAIRANMEPLFIAICTLASWLHIACGLSRASTSRVLKFLGIIIRTAVGLRQILADPTTAAAPSATDLAGTAFPRDVRSAMSALFIEPTIIRAICCPKCFTRYDLESLPQICLRRETKRARPCNENLWTVSAGDKVDRPNT